MTIPLWICTAFAAGLTLAGHHYRHHLDRALASQRHAWQAAAEAEYRAAEWERLATERAADLQAWIRRAGALGQALRRLGYSAQELEWSDGDTTYRITYVGHDTSQEVVFHD